MRWLDRASLCALALLLFVAGHAAADIVQPVNLQAKEQEPNTFLVQWQVPKLYPVQAMPEPLLPESCRTRGERVLQDQPAAWLNRQVYRCPDGLAGHRIGIQYRLVNAGQTTVMRVDFLSGEQLVHLLAEGEMWWDVPEIDAGLLAKLWPNVRRAVMQGGRHFFDAWVHIAFWLGVSLVGRIGTSVRLVTVFSAAQVVAVVLSSAFRSRPADLLGRGWCGHCCGPPGKRSLAANRRQASTDRNCSRRGFAAWSGLELPFCRHRRALPGSSGCIWLLAVVGMDAVLLTLALAGAWLGQLAGGHSWGAALRRGLGYAVGGTAVAAALVLLFSNPTVEAEEGLDTQSIAGRDGNRQRGGSAWIAPCRATDLASSCAELSGRRGIRGPA